jgi:hypothetical protein
MRNEKIDKNENSKLVNGHRGGILFGRCKLRAATKA